MQTTAQTPDSSETDDDRTTAAFIDRTRRQLKDWTAARLDDLQERTSTITEKREQLLKQGEELLKQGEDRIQAGKEAVQDRRAELLTKRDEAAKAGMERLLNLETTALEGARELLAKAEELIGPNATFLSRGRAALDDAIVSVRSGYEGGLAIEGYDDLSIRKILPLLEGLEFAEVKTLRGYEAANKKRKTMLRELDARIAAFDAPAE